MVSGPLSIILEASRRGLTFREDPPGTLRSSSPPGTLDCEFRARIGQAKPFILEALRDPRRAAVAAYERALSEVSDLFDAAAAASRGRGAEPPWMPEEDDTRLALEVRQGINGARDAKSLAIGLEAIEAWRVAWLAVLADPAPPQAPRRPPRVEALGRQARRLDGLEIRDRLNRPGLPREEAEVLHLEMDERARLAIEYSDRLAGTQPAAPRAPDGGER